MNVRQTFPVHDGSGLQADRLRTLTEISRAVSSTLDPRELYDTIYEQIGWVMDTTQFFIALRRPDSPIIDLPYLREAGALFLDEEIRFGGNVTSLVIERGTALHFHTDAEYRAYAEANGLPELTVGNDESEAKIFVALHTGRRTIGALTVQSPRSDAYTEDDVQTLSIIAAQAAVAIENARLYTAQKQRVIELQTIQSIVQKLGPLHDIPQIVGVIDRELQRLIDYHSCRVFLLDPASSTLRPVVDTEDHLFLQLGEGIAGWVAQHGQSVIVPNSLQDNRTRHIPGTPRRDESILGVPLLCKGGIRGVITLSKLGTHQFDENGLRLLEIIAAHMAMAFDRAWLYEELRLEAITDALTQLNNRRFLLDRLREEQSRANRCGQQLGAIMLDIDKFKTVNDGHGHDAGDIVLGEIANILRRTSRVQDVVARYGGEEFCVLLPDTTVGGAVQAAERLREAIASHQFPPAAGIETITVSVGVSLHAPGETGAGLLSRADLAQYEAKRSGGNLVWLNDGGGRLYPCPGLDDDDEPELDNVG